jgi:proteasome accessory factor C
VARLLLLIPYLQGHPGISLSQAAAALGLAPEQVRGDLAVAFMCGLPGGLPGDLIEVDLDLVDDEGVVYLSNAEVLRRPLRLNPDEAMGLIVALGAVRQVAAGSLHQAIDALLAKLAAVAPGLAPTPPALELAAGLEANRERLIQAISQAQRVRLTYHGVSRGQTSRPLVDPARLFTADGVAYLSAWSIGRDAWRTYRLDRIAAVEPTGDLAQAHGREPAADSWLQTLAQARPVRLRVRPAAQWMVEYYPTQGLTSLPDGDLEVTLPVADPAWLRWLLLRLGPDVTLLDDPAATADAAQAATAALDGYAAAGLA